MAYYLERAYAVVVVEREVRSAEHVVGKFGNYSRAGLFAARKCDAFHRNRFRFCKNAHAVKAAAYLDRGRIESAHSESGGVFAQCVTVGRT